MDPATASHPTLIEDALGVDVSLGTAGALERQTAAAHGEAGAAVR